MAKISMKGTGNIEEITRLLIREIQASGLSCELVNSAKKQINNNYSILLVFEKYFMRASNRASLSMMLTQHENTIHVDAIGSGGGQGALFRFSWGTESSFVNIVPQILRKEGFIEID